jgi:hypothetical protein
MTDATPATAEDVQALEELGGHYDRAIATNNTKGSVGHLRAFGIGQVPQLFAIALRGVQARVQLDALAGLSIRVEIARGLHSADDRGAGLIVCSHCSRFRHRPILFPCPTLQALDGLEAP